MNATAVSKEQIRAIHALKGRAGLDEDTYRDFLARETGKRSAKELSRGEAIHVIDGLKALSPGSSPGAGSPASRSGLKTQLSGPFAAKLRALWISAYHLGIAKDRRDSAMLAFVKRQTGIDHTRWLREPKDAAKAIEGLKAWIAREAGVDWNAHPGEPKRAVVEAQAKTLGLEMPAATSGAKLDRLMAELGEAIRAEREVSDV